MDDKGFIFTADATLALVVVIVITASIVTYVGLPIFQGEDHQHLEALADSVLETMEQNGTLRQDVALYSTNNASAQKDARNDLIEQLNLMIPPGIGYKLIIGSYDTIDSRDTDASINHTNPTTQKDVVTKSRVISGPQEGWIARAYYKQEEVTFVDQNQTQITTLWNFHNWLQNFNPWNNGLNNNPYWAGGSSQGSISFNLPSSKINGAKFLLGSSGSYQYTYKDSRGRTHTITVNSAYGANFVLNGNSNNIASSNFNDLGYSSSTGEMFNYLGNISSSELLSGLNSFYIKFLLNSTSSEYMPWFSLIGSYNTTIKVPQGVLSNTFNAPDIAGVGGDQSSNTFLYDPNTGTKTSTTQREVSWTDIGTGTPNLSQDIDTSTPFELINLPKIGQGSAVATVSNVYLPNGTRLFDAYTVINAYGGEDGAIVQVKNSTGGTWNTIFTSFGYTDRTNDGGYGNVPGILNIAPYITAGNNQVRVITWDDATSSDFDFVGLTNCYSTISYSQLPIRWDTFAFSSYQYSGTATQPQNFNIYNDAQEALLFVGTGGDTQSITVTVKKVGSSTPSQLYSGVVPYDLDLAQLDANKSTHVITSGFDANGNPILVPGNYTLTVTANTGNAYASGDFGGTTTSGPISQTTLANGEIYSGTRISIIYPKFLENQWSEGFNSTPDGAKLNATQNLENFFSNNNITYDASLIKTELIYVGDTPNAVPIRLELWKE
jgi:hypothetical protein